MPLFCETLNTNPHLLSQFSKRPVSRSKWSSPLKQLPLAENPTLLLDMTHKPSKTHKQHSLTHWWDKLKTIPQKLVISYVAWAPNTHTHTQNNNNSRFCPSILSWSGKGQRTLSTSQINLAAGVKSYSCMPDPTLVHINWNIQTSFFQGKEGEEDHIHFYLSHTQLYRV